MHSVIDDEEVEKAIAFKSSEDEATTATVKNTNGVQMHQYHVKNLEARFKYPLQLLQRILTKKKQNDELAAQLAKWKKMAYKMKQEFRMQNATTSNETIDIS